LAEQKLEQLDAGFRQSIRARDNRTNGECVNRRDFASYFSSAKEICHHNESLRWNSAREAGSIEGEIDAIWQKGAPFRITPSHERRNRAMCCSHGCPGLWLCRGSPQ
jgi:hypothetical protein